MRGVFDTNILVDHLKGITAANKALNSYEALAISRLTFMELLVGAQNDEDDGQLRAFMRGFEVIELSPAIAERAVVLRKEKRLPLPDAIIWATALEHDTVLVTRNTKDFPRRHPTIRVPYHL